MDTEVGRGVGQFHVVPGRGWQSKHCRRLQGTRQGRRGGCEPEVGGVGGGPGLALIRRLRTWDKWTSGWSRRWLRGHPPHAAGN